MASSFDPLIERGERDAQAERPTTLSYGGVRDIPCVPGNHRFWEQMSDGNAGRIKFDAQPIRVLRCDLPPAFNNPKSDIFTRGQAVVIKDLRNGNTATLVIGLNNSWQTDVLTLMLESQKA